MTRYRDRNRLFHAALTENDVLINIVIVRLYGQNLKEVELALILLYTADRPKRFAQNVGSASILCDKIQATGRLIVIFLT